MTRRGATLELAVLGLLPEHPTYADELQRHGVDVDVTPTVGPLTRSSSGARPPRA